ncbi:MAG: D-alanyl-D-alanine carboxypeptidase family protein [Patescibacteria group bacterium]
MLRSLITILMLTSMSASGGQMFYDAASPSFFDETSLLELKPVPALKHEALKPDIEAKAALIMDYDTGLLLYEKNIHEPMPMASLTKIMTAILILENHDLSEVVTVESDFAGLEGVRAWLRQGEKLTAGDLLKALLIPSAGDAAIALTEFHSGTVEDFVKAMNTRAKELNLIHTHFMNPIGLDEDGHYSSAYDLAILTKYALHFPDFRNIVKMDKARISSVNGKIFHSFESTNYLLNSYLDIQGVKTGTTDGAGQSLINLARNEQGHEVIAVILNSPARFQENKSMIDWAFRSYSW